MNLLHVLLASAAVCLDQVVAGLQVNGTRYCEILYVRSVNGSTASADVYNTFGLNLCPPVLWDAITPDNAKDDTSLAVILNGPRYWLMDEFGPLTSPVIAQRVLKNVLGLTMVLVAQVTIPWPLTTPPLYEPAPVTRNADFLWRTNTTAFFLTNEVTGDKFMMQSYSQQVDKTLTAASLPLLGSKLTALPSWWSYKAVVLSRDVNVTTPSLVGGAATVGLVLQDEFGNSYSYAGDVDCFLDRAAQCTLITFFKRLTFCLPPTVRVCGGKTWQPSGKLCQVKTGNSTSYVRGNCSDGISGLCHLTPSGGCLFRSDD
ncbi:unnamed protein product [Aphanomyces euteiches]